jgi:hypothetical protein
MSSKMQVLFVKQTGHVLAAFTRTADPEGTPSIKALVGNGLLVRNKKTIAPTPPGPPGGETFLVLPDSLDLAVVDFDSGVFALPSSFAAGGGKVEPLGNATSSSSTPVTLSNNKLKVDLGNVTPVDLKVWAQVQEVTTGGDSKPVTRVMEGKIDKTQSFAELALTISPGVPAASIPQPATYYILTLVEGLRPFFTTASLP